MDAASMDWLVQEAGGDAVIEPSGEGGLSIHGARAQAVFLLLGDVLLNVNRNSTYATGRRSSRPSASGAGWCGR